MAHHPLERLLWQVYHWCSLHIMTLGAMYVRFGWATRLRRPYICHSTYTPFRTSSRWSTVFECGVTSSCLGICNMTQRLDTLYIGRRWIHWMHLLIQPRRCLLRAVPLSHSDASLTGTCRFKGASLLQLLTLPEAIESLKLRKKSAICSLYYNLSYCKFLRTEISYLAVTLTATRIRLLAPVPVLLWPVYASVDPAGLRKWRLSV